MISLDYNAVCKVIDSIVQEYLYNVSSLKDHNHFNPPNPRDSRDAYFKSRGFHVVNNTHQHIVDEDAFLEGCTRVFLVNPIMKSLLDMCGICNDWHNGSTYGSYNTTNRAYELSTYLEFIIRYGGKNIGCRYTSCSYSSHEPANLDRDFGYLYGHTPVPGFEVLGVIDEVWAIDWSGIPSKDLSQIHIVPQGMKSNSRDISVADFLQTFFPNDVCQLFMMKVQQAIQQANGIVALKPTPQLLPNNTTTFKEHIMADFSEVAVNSFRYEFNAQRNLDCSIQISDDDREKMNAAFFSEGLMYSLFGSADFAKCFLTAEYLFGIMEDGLCIDYTSVIVGYIKAVEQLLYLIYVSAHEGNRSLTYWDSCSEKCKFDLAQTQRYRKSPYASEKYSMQEYKERTLKYGKKAPEIGRLISFVRYFDRVWNISETGKEYVVECLHDFREYCRNNHLHKDNITDHQYDKVKRIRNNARVCLYYLLGAFRLIDHHTSIYSQLGIDQYEYECLYKLIWGRRRRLFWMRCPDGYEGVVYYNVQANAPALGAPGRLLKTELCFVKFPHMTRETAFIDEINSLLLDEAYVQANTFVITQGNVPKRDNFVVISQCKKT